jgi:hypothetical protein
MYGPLILCHLAGILELLVLFQIFPKPKRFIENLAIPQPFSHRTRNWSFRFV